MEKYCSIIEKYFPEWKNIFPKWKHIFRYGKILSVMDFVEFSLLEKIFFWGYT
jgi:hypothetical protein